MSRTRKKTIKRCGSATSVSHRCALAGGDCPVPAAAGGARDPLRGAAEVGLGRAGGHRPVPDPPHLLVPRAAAWGSPCPVVGAGGTSGRASGGARRDGEGETNIPGSALGLPAALSVRGRGCPPGPVSAGGRGGAALRHLGKKVYQAIISLQLLLKI